MDKGIIIAAIIGSLTFILKEIPTKIFKIIMPNVNFSFSTTSNDKEVYLNLNEWLFNLNKKVLQNNINAKRVYIRDDYKTKFSINYGDYIFVYKKCLILLTKELIEKSYDVSDKITIKCFGFNKTVIKEEMLEFINKDHDSNMLKVYPLPDIWDSCLKGKKSFDDVFIKDKQLLINHINNWVSKRDFYNTHGIPYKTGILLYGLPGTGKTTTAKAICSHLNYDLHIINIKSYKEEHQLIKKITSVPPKSVILFEDIDCLLGNREKEEDNDTKPLLGTILNILDGLMSPEEVIFVATTNHIESLDKALIRDGRFDLKLNVDNLDVDLAEEMCTRFGVDFNKLKLQYETFPINPAYLQNKIIKYLNK